MWTHRSGHFRHSIQLGRSSQGAGIIFGENFIALAVDQSIVVLDLRLRKDKLKIEHISLENKETPGVIREFARTPKYFFLFDQEVKTEDEKVLDNINYRNLTAIIDHGKKLKKISLWSHL